ncbi:MAG: hypothetical protein JJU12_05470 [Chlamydiales bacterium]|nr:hypothetical protein [Chlamydiales bacterium]
MKLCYLIIILVLTACNSHKEWTYSEVVSAAPELNSKQLRYRIKDEITGIEVELLEGAFGRFAYLNVCARQIPSLPGDACRSIVVFVIDDEKLSFQAERMLGGQKLLLPDEAIKKLIDSLDNNRSVSIYLDGFQTELKPSNFHKVYKNFRYSRIS